MIPDAVRTAIESGRLAHIATINPDGSPQMSCVWVGIDGDEIVIGSLPRNRKVQNVLRDPRVKISMELGRKDARLGLAEYVVITGRARIVEGGAPELLQRLAHVYMGPGVKFPPMPNPPPGYVIRIEPVKFAGNWSEPA